MWRLPRGCDDMAVGRRSRSAERHFQCWARDLTDERILILTSTGAVEGFRECPPPTLDEALLNIRSIQGRVTALRPVNRPDFPTFYDWRSQLAVSPTWTTNFRRVVRFEEFVNETDAWLRESVTMMAVDRQTGVPVGFARAYHLNLVDGWVYVQGFIDEAHRLSLHTAETTILFGTYLFQQFPLRKICSEVFAFNEPVLRMHRKVGFRECGKLRDHIWYRDRYWDLVQFELFRDDWDEATRRFSFLTSIEQETTAQIASNGR